MLPVLWLEKRTITWLLGLDTEKNRAIVICTKQGSGVFPVSFRRDLSPKRAAVLAQDERASLVPPHMPERTRSEEFDLDLSSWPPLGVAPSGMLS